MISLDDEIKKDKEASHRHRRDKRDRPYRHRGEDNQQRRNYQQRNYQERQPVQQQKMIIKISNLHYSVNKEQLQEICNEYGKVKMCRIDWDRMGRSNETATLEYFSRQDEDRAVREMNGRQMEGQKLKVELVKDTSFFAPKKHHINKAYGRHQGGSNRNSQWD